MNRKEFLRSCACGFCACAVLNVPVSADTPAPAAEPPKPEDWRFGFIKQRYAKLLGNLDRRMGGAGLDDALREQGRYCASTYDLVQKHKGDIDGFLPAFIEQTKQEVTYDRAQGVITVAGRETKDCFCPLIDTKTTPQSACNCSLGWNQYVFETTTGKRCEVLLKESVLRGGKRCVFEVKVTGTPAT